MDSFVFPKQKQILFSSSFWSPDMAWGVKPAESSETSVSKPAL